MTTRVSTFGCTNPWCLEGVRDWDVNKSISHVDRGIPWSVYLGDFMGTYREDIDAGGCHIQYNSEDTCYRQQAFTISMTCSDVKSWKMKKKVFWHVKPYTDTQDEHVIIDCVYNPTSKWSSRKEQLCQSPP